MNYSLIKYFIEKNGIFTIVISLILLGLELLAEKFLKDKISGKWKNISELFTAFVLSFIYEIISEKKFVVSANFLYSGVISYSVFTAVKTVVKKIVKGEKLSSFDTALIGEIIRKILSEVVNKDAIDKVVKNVLNVLLKNLSKEETSLEIENTIKENADIGDADVLKLVEQIINSVFK